MLDDLQVDVSDERLLKRFGSHIWFLDDPRIVNVVRECRDGKPVIQRYLYRNLKRRGLCMPLYKHFQADRTMEYRCFYTGAEAYLTAGRLLGGARTEPSMSLPMWQIPWALTREHVVPSRERDSRLTNSIGNMVVCSLFLNKQMCHMPLAMKLAERDYLHAFAFDRQAMSYETARQVHDAVVAFEQPFWFVDNYPWFPHAIKNDEARGGATEFFDHLRQHEERFLALSWQDQRHYLRQPCDLDIKHLARSILGLVIY